MIRVKIDGTGFYGNPEVNSQYWVKQSYENCILMAAAMVVGQMRGNVEEEPTEDEIVNYAKITDSIVVPGKKVYINENTSDGATAMDTAMLLRKYYDLNAEFTTYSTPAVINGEQTSVATVADGQRALLDVQAALARGEGVIVGVNAQIMWAAVQCTTGSCQGGNGPGIPDYQTPNHGVVVIGVDVENGIVYLNDSGPETQGQMVKDKDGNMVKRYPLGEPVTLGAFMSAWQTDSYETIFVSKKA